MTSFTCAEVLHLERAKFQESLESFPINRICSSQELFIVCYIVRYSLFSISSSSEFENEVIWTSARDRDLMALAQVEGNVEVKCGIEFDLSHQPKQADSLKPLLNKG